MFSRLKMFFFSSALTVITFVAMTGADTASWLTWYEPELPEELRD